MILFALALLLLIGTQVFHMIRLELTMGRSIPDAGTVSEEMFTAFVKSDIMPHLEFGTILAHRHILKKTPLLNPYGIR